MKTITAGLIVCSFLQAGLANSHSGASGVVKESMDAMTDMADKSKLVADMFKGKTEFDRIAITDD